METGFRFCFEEIYLKFESVNECSLPIGWYLLVTGPTEVYKNVGSVICSMDAERSFLKHRSKIRGDRDRTYIE